MVCLDIFFCPLKAHFRCQVQQCVKVCVCVCKKDLKQVWSDEKVWVKCVFCTLPRGYSSLYKVLVVFQNSGTWIREASFDTHIHTHRERERERETSVMLCHTSPSLKHTHTHTCVHTSLFKGHLDSGPWGVSRTVNINDSYHSTFF